MILVAGSVVGTTAAIGVIILVGTYFYKNRKMKNNLHNMLNPEFGDNEHPDSIRENSYRK
jgi:hypothetical protein